MNTRSARPLQAVPEPGRERRIEWTDAELVATEFPPPRWAVLGLISEGLNILAGAPKLGKSWLSLGLGAAVSLGEPALGSIPVEQGPVLYLALEDTGLRLQKRRRTMLAAGGRPSLHLRLRVACPLWSAGGEAEIAAWLDEHPDARLVIIDTFEKIRGRSGSSGSAYADDYIAAGRIKALADAYGVPVLLVHHVRKAAADDFLATVSGTNGIAGAADTILVLERPRGEADGVLHVTGRDVEEADHAMNFDPTTGAWTKLGGPAGDYLLSDTRALITRFLRDYPSRKPKEIADALQLPPATVRQTCKRMVAAGQLRVDGSGHYHPTEQRDSGADPDLSHLSRCHATAPDQGE
jgi:DNA-binding Lrp family transcriptional regulator